MESNKTGKFFIGSLLIVVVVVVAINLLLNSMLDLADSSMEPEKMDAEAISERLKPIARENVGEEPIVQAAAVNNDTPVADNGGDAGMGQQIVTQVCATCHSSGMMNSPRLGSASDWAPRLEKGIETLYDNAINGFNMMPARGGRSNLTDEEVKAAVDYMISAAE